MEISPKHSFILKLTPEELDVVCDDLVMFHEGYNFFYAVDTYDFTKFFFPYIENAKLNYGDLNKLAQEKIAYETLFAEDDLGVDNIILLDEYKRELLLVRDMFLSKIKSSEILVNNIEDLATDILNLFEKGEDVIEVINRNYELFFLCLLYESRKGDLDDLSFVKFLKRTIHINSFETNDEQFNEIADELFGQVDDEKISNAVFDQFVDKSALYLKRFRKNQVEHYLRNTYKDIQAINRVYRANEGISKNKKYRKTMFFYLSSAPFKSDTLSSIVGQYYNKDLIFSSNSDKTHNNVHRNIFQYFMFHTFSRNKELTLPKALEFLTFIRNEILLSKKNEEADAVEQKDDQLFISGKIKNLNENLISDLENNFYQPLIENYKVTLQKIIEDSKTGESKQKIALRTFKDYLSYQVGTIEYIKSKYEHNKNILSVLKRMDKIDSKIKIKFPGKELDIIQFNFHHLPYLPFLFEKKLTSKYYPLYLAMREISNIENNKENNGRTILVFLRDLLSTKVNVIKELPFEFLFLGYMDLLIVDNDESITYENQESKFMDELKSQLLISETISNKLRLALSPHRTAIRNEIIYIMLWLLRRNGEHDRLLNFENEITNMEFKDPRLFHGLALGYISVFHKQQEKSPYAKILLVAIEHLKTAEKGYRLELANQDNRVIKELIIKNLIGIWNSICDSYNFIYDSTPNIEFLNDATLCMSKIHKYIKELNLVYDDFPTLNNTEAGLLCNFSLLALKDNNFTKAAKILEISEEKYSISIRKESMMNELFTLKLKARIDSIRGLINEKSPPKED